MLVVSKYFLYFFIYAFLGWVLEVICKLFEKKKFVNRGFLIGPICPIYGYGVLGIVLLIGNNTNGIFESDFYLFDFRVCNFLFDGKII